MFQVYLAEQGLCRLCEEGNVGGAGGVPLDPAWQEMLNHATSRVNQAEADRAAAGARHRITVDQHRVALSAARNLQHSLKRHVGKSRLFQLSFSRLAWNIYSMAILFLHHVSFSRLYPIDFAS